MSAANRSRVCFLNFGVRDRREIVIQPRRHTQNIAVHRRNRQPERDRRHRACRIFTDTGQREQFIVVGGQFAAVLLAQQDRCTVQVAHAAVVAEPLPELGVNGLVRRRESREYWAARSSNGKNSRARPPRASAAA